MVAMISQWVGQFLCANIGQNPLGSAGGHGVALVEVADGSREFPVGTAELQVFYRILISL
jgi:hypothetical protein